MRFKKVGLIIGILIIVLLVGSGALYSEFNKAKDVVYTYIKEKNGEEVADKVKIKPTLDYTKKFGYKINVYNYEKFTGIDEVIYFYMKADNGWTIASIKTEP